MKRLGTSSRTEANEKGKSDYYKSSSDDFISYLTECVFQRVSRSVSGLS